MVLLFQPNCRTAHIEILKNVPLFINRKVFFFKYSSSKELSFYKKNKIKKPKTHQNATVYFEPIKNSLDLGAWGFKLLFFFFPPEYLIYIFH